MRQILRGLWGFARAGNRIAGTGERYASLDEQAARISGTQFGPIEWLLRQLVNAALAGLGLAMLAIAGWIANASAWLDPYGAYGKAIAAVLLLAIAVPAVAGAVASLGWAIAKCRRSWLLSAIDTPYEVMDAKDIAGKHEEANDKLTEVAGQLDLLKRLQDELSQVKQQLREIGVDAARGKSAFEVLYEEGLARLRGELGVEVQRIKDRMASAYKGLQQPRPEGAYDGQFRYNYDMISDWSREMIDVARRLDNLQPKGSASLVNQLEDAKKEVKGNSIYLIEPSHLSLSSEMRQQWNVAQKQIELLERAVSAYNAEEVSGKTGLLPGVIALAQLEHMVDN